MGLDDTKCPEALIPNIIPLTPAKAPEKSNDIARHRFKILKFKNRGGSTAWRVTGTRRDGGRVRENFPEQRAAEIRRAQLEAEFFSRTHQDSALRATRLTDAQLRIAEACFIRLDQDEEIFWATNYWLEHGRNQSLPESPRIDEAFEAFQQWLDSTPKLRERTKANLRLRVKVFANSIGNFRIADITPEVVESYLQKRDVSAASRDNDRRAISRFFRWAIERPRRWAKVNPCREVHVETNGETAPPAVLSITECSNLLKASERHRKGRLVPYVALCLFGGLRPFEATRLTWEQVNLQDREIRLEAHQTKTKRPRVIAINDTLLDWLNVYKGKPFYPANWRKDFDIIKAAAGFGNPTRLSKKQRAKTPALKTWPEDVMRHTSVSHYFRKTGSYGQTAEQFGNSEAVIKKHYQGRVSSQDTQQFYALKPGA